MKAIVAVCGLLLAAQGREYFVEVEKYNQLRAMFGPDPQLARIRILSLNLFLRPPLIKTNKSDYKDLRTDYFIANFLSMYDIVCLQEVFGLLNYRKERLIEQGKRLGFHYHAESPAAGAFSGYIVDGGLLVLSRLPIVEVYFHPYRESAMPDSLSQKGLLYCKIKTRSDYLHLFTSHLQSSYPVTDPSLHVLYRETRRLQLQEVREFVTKHIREQDFALLLGDLNVDSRESYKPLQFADLPTNDYEVMMEILGDQTKDLGLLAYGFHPVTFGKKKGDGSPDETVLTDVREQGGEYSLDYILQLSSSPLLRVQANSTKVAEFYVVSQPFTQVSDHFGLETTLEVLS